VSLPAWLRFAEMSLLAGWLILRAYQPSAKRSGEALLPALAGVLAAVQLTLEAAAATDPFTPLTQVLPSLLGSGYGGLSAAVAVMGLAAAVWLWRRTRTSASIVLAGVLLAISGASSITSTGAVTAAASSGDLAMSTTLAVPRSTLTTPNPYASDSRSAVRGQAIYQQYCLSCHGLNGDGNGPAVAGLRIRPPTFRNPQHFLAPGMDGAHFWVIQHGDGVAGGMPAWDGTLTPQQMWDAVDYIKSIAAGRPGQAPAAAATASSRSSQPGG